MSHFDAAVKEVLGQEGGYVNNPADPGGETKFGISRKSYPTTNIRELTLEQATAIYRRDFWEPYGFELITSEPIVVKVFDMAVNMGPATAIKLLQRACNYLLAPGYRLGVDGILGPTTAFKVNTVIDHVWLLRALRAYHASWYIALVESRPADEAFARDWIKRAMA